MSKVKLEKNMKKQELNPMREQALSFINDNLPNNLDKKTRAIYKKKYIIHLFLFYLFKFKAIFALCVFTMH